MEIETDGDDVGDDERNVRRSLESQCGFARSVREDRLRILDVEADHAANAIGQGEDADRVGLNIQRRYATLVRSNSVFWNASGISATLDLKGLEVHTGSIASILAGGVAFATPDSPGHEVKPGSVFRMHDEVKDAWLEWSPLIWRGPPPGEAPPAAAGKKKEGAASRIARFFHHENKDEGEAEKAGEPTKDSSQEGAHEEKRHGFFHDLFHKKDQGKDEEKD
jgi:hypothetical protein